MAVKLSDPGNDVQVEGKLSQSVDFSVDLHCESVFVGRHHMLRNEKLWNAPEAVADSRSPVREEVDEDDDGEECERLNAKSATGEHRLEEGERAGVPVNCPDDKQSKLDCGNEDKVKRLVHLIVVVATVVVNVAVKIEGTSTIHSLI